MEKQFSSQLLNISNECNMVGKVVDSEVVIEDQSEATRNYSKGNFGTMKRGTLHLHFIEASFLVEMGRIEVKKDGKQLSLQTVMNYALPLHKNFEIDYLVFRDLRQRGYVVKICDEGFELYPRGGAPPSSSPVHLVKAISERTPFHLSYLLEWMKETKNKALLIGIGDEEGDLTYYSVKFFRMRGKMKEEDSYKGNITLLHDRCMVWDEVLAEKIQKNHIGRIFEKGSTQISLTEAAYLAEKGAIVMKDGRKKLLKTFLKHAKKIQPDIEIRLRVYTHLWQRGLIPKTGYKFGSHFRVYREDPDKGHAPYLVHVLPIDYASTWTEISRAIRLAHSVRKQMVFACVGDNIDFIRLKRVTP